MDISRSKVFLISPPTLLATVPDDIAYVVLLYEDSVGILESLSALH